MADYHKLACMIANHGEAAMFRRFDTLQVKVLLYMKAELVNLEAELRQMETDGKFSADPSKTAYPFSVYDLRDSACSGNVTQWTKYQEIQGKLQAYSMSFELWLYLANCNLLDKTVHCSNTLPSARSPNLLPTVSNSFESGWTALKAETSSSRAERLTCGRWRKTCSPWIADDRAKMH